MIFNKIKKKVLRVQITGTCMIVSIITSLIIVFLCYFGFYNLSKRNEIQSHEYNLSLAVTSFNNTATKINEYITWCKFDYDIQNYLKLSAEYDSNPSLKTLFNISSVQTYEKVNSRFFSSISAYVDRLIISTLDGNHYIHIMSKDIPSSYQPAKDILSMPFFPTENDNSDIIWEHIENDLFSNSSRRQFIPVINKIYDHLNHAIGYIYLEISTDILKNILLEYPQVKTMPYIEIHGHLYNIDHEQFTISKKSFTDYSPFKTTWLNDNTSLLRKNIWEPLAIRRGTSVSGIFLIQTISRNFFTLFNLKSNLMILIFIFSLIITSGILISSILKHLINTPIKEINGQLRSIGQGILLHPMKLDTKMK